MAVIRMRSRQASAPEAPASALYALVGAQTVSVIGTQVTALALPTLAILLLHTGPFAASLLFALEYGVQGLTAPAAGALVDRVASRRALLVTLDIAQVLVIVSVPIAHAVGALSIAQLYAVAAVSGVLGGASAIAVPAFTPQIVAADQLVSANARLAGARSVGQIAGPGAAAGLVQGLGGAVAMLADAISYGVSAVLMLVPRIAVTPSRRKLSDRQSLVESLRDGVSVIRARPALLRVAVAAAALNLGGAGLGGLYTYFAYRVAHLSPVEVGATLVAYSVAAVVAVLTAKRVVRRVGNARIVPVFAPLAAAALFLIPGASVIPALPTLIAYELIFGFCATVWSISSVTLQQRLTPAEHLGRVLGLSRAMSMLVIPIGALLGGAAAASIGTTPTLILFASLALAGTLAVVAVPQSTIAEGDEPVTATAAGSAKH